MPLLVWMRLVTSKGKVIPADLNDLLEAIQYLEIFIRHETNMEFVRSPSGVKGKVRYDDAKTLLEVAEGNPYRAQRDAGIAIERRAIAEAIKAKRNEDKEKSGNQQKDGVGSPAGGPKKK